MGSLSPTRAAPSRRCAALLLGAPGSGHGKTTATAALARRAARGGRRVRVFKIGADFLDPMLLQQACGSPVYNLDLYLGSPAHCRRLLFDAAGEADLLLVEGMMGLFDGRPSAADLAALLGLPVLGLIDASAMAQTFGAVAQGLHCWRGDLRWAGMLANRVAGSAHAALLRDALPAGLRWAGWLQAQPDAELPQRHLGLVQPEHVDNLQARLDAAADALRPQRGWRAPMVTFQAPPAQTPQPLLRGVRIAVAQDEAFCFVYPANLDCLRAMGAELRFFSPLRDAAIPPCDALWLPGGYPELHLRELGANTPMLHAVRAHAAERPLLAECGGMLYLCRSLADIQGATATLAGVLPGDAAMQHGLQALGPQAWHQRAGELRGHTFHHSRLRMELAAADHARSPLGGRGEAVWRQARVTASYVHWYFASAPHAAAALFLR